MPGPDLPSNGLRIGVALKRARTGRGMDIRSAEELTKIRARYLRALEAEDWEVLPSPVYARGFLRTYASVLGLDADAIADEFRRQVERQAPDAAINPLGEPMLERRVRPEERRGWRVPRIAWLIAVAAVAAVVVLAVVGSGGGGNGHRGRHHDGRGGGGHQQQKQQHRKGQGSAPAPGGPVGVVLTARQAVQACLVRDAHQPVIDSQALNAGSVSGPFQPARRYRLDLETGGTVELTLNGRKRVARAPRRASFVITSAGVREVGFRGPHCP